MRSDAAYRHRVQISPTESAAEIMSDMRVRDDVPQGWALIQMCSVQSRLLAASHCARILTILNCGEDYMVQVSPQHATVGSTSCRCYSVVVSNGSQVSPLHADVERS